MNVLLRWSLASIAFLAVVVLGLPRAHADRAQIADALNKLSASAASLAQTAKASDDRGARKKFGPAAQDLGDDLAALARRAAKDVPLKTIGKDAAEIDKDASALVDLADEAEDKDERKTLRQTATLIQQGIAGVRKSIDAEAAKSDGKASEAPQRFTGRLFNNSNDCSWAENLRFAISRNGQQVVETQLVFPGRDHSLVLEKGSYLVQLLDTTKKSLGQATLEVGKEGWTFKSGCVNQD